MTVIRVTKDYYIEVEAGPVTNYAVKRGSGIRDEKNRNKDKVIGYGKDMQNALNIIREKIIAERLEDDFPTVSDALRAIREENRNFAELVRGLTT